MYVLCLQKIKISTCNNRTCHHCAGRVHEVSIKELLGCNDNNGGRTQVHADIQKRGTVGSKAAGTAAAEHNTDSATDNATAASATAPAPSSKQHYQRQTAGAVPPTQHRYNHQPGHPDTGAVAATNGYSTSKGAPTAAGNTGQTTAAGGLVPQPVPAASDAVEVEVDADPCALGDEDVVYVIEVLAIIPGDRERLLVTTV